jgi:predicted CXXCH cytochrome family protein
VDYEAAAVSHPGRFHPAGSLPYAIPLVRGRVECTTCHDGASPDPKRVTPVRDLCVACHNL